jgi:hypothetical protein
MLVGNPSWFCSASQSRFRPQLCLDLPLAQAAQARQIGHTLAPRYVPPALTEDNGTVRCALATVDGR